MIHFEQLWEKCEEVHRQSDSNGTLPVLDSLQLKIELYKTVSKFEGLSEEEKRQAKSLALGEILFSLTNLSYQDNIDVFRALQTALYNKEVSLLDKKY
jgi:hypothetical protein